MKRKLLALFLLLLPLLAQVGLAAPSVSAPEAILIDAKTGIVLYERNAHQKAYPASTTKIMTAILALENGNMDEMVTVSFDAVNSISYDSSKAGLFEGETFTLKDMVYTLLVCSANDSANVIAEHIAGDIDAFVEKMNTRAAELGAKNTHFVNTHGLHDDNHYTTAYDLAILTRHALSLPHFRDIIETRQYILEPTDKYEEVRYCNSTNHLLNPQSPYYYADAIGVKTGYTDRAKSCLVAAAETDGATYISVVMGAESIEGQTMSFVDSRALLRFGAEECAPQILAPAGTLVWDIPVQRAKGTKVVAGRTAENISICLPPGVSAEGAERLEYIKTDLEAPVHVGDVIGKLEYRYGDIVVGKAYLLADEEIEKQGLISRFFSWIFSSVWVWGILILLFFIVFARRLRRARARSRRRKMAEMRRRNKYQ